MTRLVRAAGVLGVLAGALPLAGAAQDSPPDAWDFRLEFGLNGASGNSSFTVMQAGFGAEHTRTEAFELELTAAARYGRNDEKVIANDAHVSLKFDFRPQAVISPFAFVDASRDEIRRLDFQADGGAGAKWTFLARDASEASFSAAALVDYQNFELPGDSTEPGSETNARWSFRVKGERTFPGGAAIEHTSFYQPVIDRFGDYLVQVTNSLSTTLVGSLSMSLQHRYLRDSVPPPGARRDDQKYSVVLRVVF